MKKILILLLFISQQLFSQATDKLFEKGNEHYKLAEYSEAISSYQEIETLGFVSSELYYNLGNCYYKLNKVAPAIYNYEKALLINPLNEDAQSNLVFAKRLTIDAIEELPKTIFQKLDTSLVKKLSYNEWATVAVVFFCSRNNPFSAILFFIYSFKKTIIFCD